MIGEALALGFAGALHFDYQLKVSDYPLRVFRITDPRTTGDERKELVASFVSAPPCDPDELSSKPFWKLCAANGLGT